MLNLVEIVSVSPDFYQWITQLMKNELSNRNETLRRTRQEQELKKDTLIQNMRKAYQDKLDGKIPEDFFKDLYSGWQTELDKINLQLQSLENTFESSYDWGKKAIELSYRAKSLYLRQNSEEQRELLQKILSNCELKDGTLYPTYRKPFDILMVSGDKNKWRRGWDSEAHVSITPCISSYYKVLIRLSRSFIFNLF